MKDFNRSNEFKKDLDYGKWGEGVVIPFITELFKREKTFISYWYSIDDMPNIKKSQLKEWDLRFGVYNYTDRINFTDKVEFEIKTDMYDINTGNLIFEKSSNNKKSGVFATKAKYFLYFLPLFKEDNIYIIKSENLRNLLIPHYNNYLVQGGDIGSNTFMYKINRNDFNEQFIKSGGKILTYNNYSIPSRFEGKKQFELDDKKKYTYYSNDKKLKEYDDPFKFE